MLIALAVPPDNPRGPLYMDHALAGIHQGNPHRLPMTLEFAVQRDHVCLFCGFPTQLRGIVESQVYAQYPECTIRPVPEESLRFPADACVWTVDLCLAPDLFPMKRYAQFEDAINRQTADPLTAILTTLRSDRQDRLQRRIQVAIRPARARQRRRRVKCLHHLASPFFRSHRTLAHLYVRLALSPWFPVRLLGVLLGRLGHHHDPRMSSPLDLSATRLHDREDDLQAASDKLGKLLFECQLRLIDPHGDLANAVLASIPKQRTNDVVLFDAGDTDHPLSFNVLDCNSSAERPLVASGIVSAFKRLYGEFWGPRLEHVLRNALLALLETPGSSLLSLLRLLSDPKYRTAVAARITDPVVQNFWQREFAGMPSKLQAEAIAPIQNKVGQFVSSPILRNILGQARNTLRPRQLMDEGKVLLVNLSKGRIGDDASSLLGSFLVTALQLAAMSRADLPEHQRRDFFLYVDEFQSFATDSFASILSEARKYRLSLTIANQYLAQVEEATLHAMFGNIGSLLTFQVGAKDAELLAEQLGGDLTPQDLLRLPRYHAYARVLIDGMPSRPFSMVTLPPATSRDQAAVRSEIIRRASRHRYARPLKAVEDEIRHAVSRS